MFKITSCISHVRRLMTTLNIHIETLCSINSLRLVLMLFCHNLTRTLQSRAELHTGWSRNSLCNAYIIESIRKKHWRKICKNMRYPAGLWRRINRVTYKTLNEVLGDRNIRRMQLLKEEVIFLVNRLPFNLINRR